jgi:hypothetical protein
MDSTYLKSARSVNWKMKRGGCTPSLREVASAPFSRCRDYLHPSFTAANPAASRSAPEGATLAALFP